MPPPTMAMSAVVSKLLQSNLKHRPDATIQLSEQDRFRRHCCTITTADGGGPFAFPGALTKEMLMQRTARAAVAAAVAASASFSTVALAFATTLPADPREIIKRSIAALNVGHDLPSITSVKCSALLISRDTQQNDYPDAPRYATVEHAVITDDLAGGRLLTQATSINGESYANTLLTADLMQREMLSTNGSWTLVGTAAPPSWQTQDALRTLALAQAAADLRLEHPATLHDHMQNVVSFHNKKYLVKVYFDTLTSLPSAIEATVEYSGASTQDSALNVWGDVRERTEFLDWRPVEGLRLPFQRDEFRNDELYLTVRLSEAHVNVPLVATAFEIQAAARHDAAQRIGVHSLPLGHSIMDAPNPNHPISEIAPGVVQIPGSWYSTLVRQPDGLVVIDAPISAEYSQKVLAEAQRRFPGVPVKALITSTSFLPHVAGIREYAARGIPIYVRDHNVALVRRLLASRHTLVPDDLERDRKTPIIRAVSDRTVIGSGHNSVLVMPIRWGTEDMLMTYLPGAHLLHTGAMVQPLGIDGALLYPESLLEIKDSVRDEKLQVDTIIGVHLSPTPWHTVGDTLQASSTGAAVRP